METIIDTSAEQQKRYEMVVKLKKTLRGFRTIDDVTLQHLSNDQVKLLHKLLLEPAELFEKMKKGSMWLQKASEQYAGIDRLVPDPNSKVATFKKTDKATPNLLEKWGFRLFRTYRNQSTYEFAAQVRTDKLWMEVLREENQDLYLVSYRITCKINNVVRRISTEDDIEKVVRWYVKKHSIMFSVESRG